MTYLGESGVLEIPEIHFNVLVLVSSVLASALILQVQIFSYERKKKKKIPLKDKDLF